MVWVLGYASNADDSASNLQLIMLGLGLVVVGAILASGLVLAARGRGHRQLQLLGGLAVVWAVIAVGSALWFAEARTEWAKDRQIRLESGYASDSNSSDAQGPAAPALLWGGLGVTYLLLVAWTFLPAGNGNDDGTTDAH